ncbi:alpha/beta fold hydrolase [Homoserinibacter sp. YIM 151385]|uniref:alpha/beta fold hydrolase n=1 Tax=Homoserinibacter sp. YIM 151385 TaxID=2985506 RepID=UPI0022F06D45|nr:alpha/beta hydrolase [Homoserinibacter sp. YIM 151385]WBU39091.1 alpha/beta hydrolase [Homoserinibacter sp. YIM 151385]
MTGAGTASARSATAFAVSADGTRIAYETVGRGPLLVLVDGAMCARDFGPARDVAASLADAFTVIAYDRRGRGESGNTEPYAVAREIEDLTAVIEAGGGEALVLGQSSGAGLALEAAAAGAPITRLASYEAPWVGRRAGRDGAPLDHHGTLDRLIAEGRNGRAVDYFMVTMVNGPKIMPIMMRLMRKAWRHLLAVAPTLRYDAAVMGDFEVPRERLAAIRIPVLALCGEKAAPEMDAAQRAIAEAVPGARHAVLSGQTHMVSPAALGPELRAFFA